MMGWQTGDQRQLFYLFNLERRIPASHLLRRINPVVMQVLADLREKLAPFYSDIGRPSIDPELMIRMLIVGYCYGIRFERRLCEEVELHLAYRWFCRLDLDDKVPDHSTFSVNRHGRFRDSNILRHVFEADARPFHLQHRLAHPVVVDDVGQEVGRVDLRRVWLMLREKFLDRFGIARSAP